MTAQSLPPAPGTWSPPRLDVTKSWPKPVPLPGWFPHSVPQVLEGASVTPKRWQDLMPGAHRAACVLPCVGAG